MHSRRVAYHAGAAVLRRRLDAAPNRRSGLPQPVGGHRSGLDIGPRPGTLLIVRAGWNPVGDAAGLEGRRRAWRVRRVSGRTNVRGPDERSTLLEVRAVVRRGLPGGLG